MTLLNKKVLFPPLFINLADFRIYTNVITGIITWLTFFSVLILHNTSKFILPNYKPARHLIKNKFVNTKTSVAYVGQWAGALMEVRSLFGLNSAVEKKTRD